MVWADGEVPRGWVSVHGHTCRDTRCSVHQALQCPQPALSFTNIHHIFCSAQLLSNIPAAQILLKVSFHLGTDGHRGTRAASAGTAQLVMNLLHYFILWSETCRCLLSSSICFPARCSLAFQALIKFSLQVSLLLLCPPSWLQCAVNTGLLCL